MEQIFKDNDFNFLTLEQKNRLYNSISVYADQYISDNRISVDYKCNIELEKYLNIKFNLNTSEKLKNELLKDDKIEDIPWYEPYKLNNKLWQSYIDKLKKNQETKELMSAVNIFKCRQCGENKCMTYELQTRSNDEPMTTFIKCLVCGVQWQQS